MVSEALQRAVAAVDRELAADLEMTTMFDQTRQAVVLENGEFARVRDVLAAELRLVDFAFVDGLYAGIPGVESAMERRGPAHTLRDADRLIVESWEGDAREAQRVLRAALLPPLPPATAVSAPRGPLARFAAAVRRLFT